MVTKKIYKLYTPIIFKSLKKNLLNLKREFCKSNNKFTESK
jgi:hypothetical protein